MKSLTAALHNEAYECVSYSCGDLGLLFAHVATKTASGAHALLKRFPTKSSAALSSIGSLAITFEGINSQNAFLTAAGLGIGLADLLLVRHGDPAYIEGEPDPQDAPLHINDLIDFKNHPHESTVTAATAAGLAAQALGGLEGQSDQLAFTLSAAFDAAALGAVVLIRQKDADHAFGNTLSKLVQMHPTKIAGALELVGLAAFSAYQIHQGQPFTPADITMLAAYGASGACYMTANKRRLRFGPAEKSSPLAAPQLLPPEETRSGPYEENAVNL